MSTEPRTVSGSFHFLKQNIIMVKSYGEIEAMTLTEALDKVPDPGGRHGRRHPIGAILTLAVRAMMCGARSLYAISQWGRDHGPAMSRSLGFSRDQTPSVATLHRVLRRLDRDSFEKILGEWMRQNGLNESDAIAVDGKSLGGIHGEQVPGVHLVSAFSHQSGEVIGQKSVEDKGGELGALRRLLNEVDIDGRVITGDAQFTQHRDCETIVSKGGTTTSQSRPIRRVCLKILKRSGWTNNLHRMNILAKGRVMWKPDRYGHRRF